MQQFLQSSSYTSTFLYFFFLKSYEDIAQLSIFSLTLIIGEAKFRTHHILSLTQCKSVERKKGIKISP